MATEPTVLPLSRSLTIAGTTRHEITGTWSVARAAAGSVTDPAAARATLAPDAWRSARVPGTVVGALIAAGEWDWDAPPNIDADDWWYNVEFEKPSDADGPKYFLNFEGLATIAEVWLNDERILSSESMWAGYSCEVTAQLRQRNTLMIRFPSLLKALEAKRPRPRWRTRVVEHQQLRWYRTSWLGRMPGWAPASPVIGPWRGVYLSCRASVFEDNYALQASVEGSSGVLNFGAQLFGHTERPTIRRAVLRCGAHEIEARVKPLDEHVLVHTVMNIPDAKLWWPHTHGDPTLYDVSITVETDNATETTSLGRVGFRTLSVDKGADGKGFTLNLNNAKCFMRGACWAPVSAATLDVSEAEYRTALQQVKDAGFNMVRISGTMAYESPLFHELCDELGIMVWQDFMFANMDYPVADEHFAKQARTEAVSVIRSLNERPSLAVLCGGSEIFQQAAMLGLSEDAWSNSLSNTLLTECCAEFAPDVPYVPNSPSGGALPFAVNESVSHYYGVGAYRRPLEDARRANVRFTSECLGFANVPEQRTVELLTTPAEVAPHHPRWKARVPRDRGAGWDFDDVRDHYFGVLFGVDPVDVRYANPDRYLAMSRIVSGEVMSRTIAEWRRADSSCSGAIIWMHRDLWPGAGWGIVDSTGLAKPAYWYVARACAPVAVLLTDEGVNGLAIHVTNDSGSAINADVVVQLWNGRNMVAESSEGISVTARSTSTRSADAILRRFTDVSYAYRFGPPGHDLVYVTLRDQKTGATLSEAHHFPLGLPTGQSDLGVSATAVAKAPGEWELSVCAEGAATAVMIELPGFVPTDSYFQIAPGATKRITLRSGSNAVPSGTVFPLNAEQPTRVIVRSGDEQKRSTSAS